jgi:hypothetical protein
MGVGAKQGWDSFFLVLGRVEGGLSHKSAREKSRRWVQSSSNSSLVRLATSSMNQTHIPHTYTLSIALDRVCVLNSYPEGMLIYYTTTGPGSSVLLCRIGSCAPAYSCSSFYAHGRQQVMEGANRWASSARGEAPRR